MNGAEAQGCVEFEVEVRPLAKSMGVIGKLIDEGCFEPKNSDVVFEQMDPSHVALGRMTIDRNDLRELAHGARLCMPLKGLNNVLKRARAYEDETVKLSCEEDKVKVRFPQTDREFRIERLDIEPAEMPRPTLAFDAKAMVSTKELKAVLKDVEKANLVKLSTTDEGLVLSAETDEESYSKDFRKGSPHLLGYEARAPTTAQYAQKYLDDITTTDFDVATLRWSSNKPIEVSYNPMPRSRLEFLLAPRIEAE